MYYNTLHHEVLASYYSPSAIVYDSVVHSFVQMTRYLITNKEGLFILSERGLLENYFGKQRTRGGRNENPTVPS